MNQERFTTLLHEFTKGNINATDRAALMDAVHEGHFDHHLTEEILEKLRISGTTDAVWNPEKSNILLEEILSPAAVQSVRKLQYGKWAAAAALIIAAGLGVYYFSNQSSTSNAINGGTGETRGTVVDIAPGINRAILTIDNNPAIDLTSDKQGIHINNTITYNDGEKIADAGQVLQLSTPRGGQYQVVLPDGSKVWLNAASSIKFLSKFNNKERRVEINGEAYFEIAKDASKPFRVYNKKQQIEVLGTAFNVNAYSDETTVTTTLMEGAVKINNQILKPGQAYTDGKIVAANISQTIAWKNGLFIFNNASIESVMKQLARWYNLDIVYESRIDKHFTATIPQNVPLSQVLKALENTGEVRFVLNEHTVTVTH